MNSLAAILLAAHAVGIDARHAADTLQHFKPPAGRGERLTLVSPRGPFTLIDESYNANPASMRAALALLGDAPKALGRRIAVLGDMLELGAEAPHLHRELAEEIERNQVEVVYAAGPLMKHLFDALPNDKRGAWHLLLGRSRSASLRDGRGRRYRHGEGIEWKSYGTCRQGAQGAFRASRRDGVGVEC